MVTAKVSLDDYLSLLQVNAEVGLVAHHAHSGRGEVWGELHWISVCIYIVRETDSEKDPI